MASRLITCMIAGSLLLLASSFPAFASTAGQPKGKSVDFNHGSLAVSQNGRYLVHTDGTPFFYLGDTAWLLFRRLNIDEAETYLENRRQKGFTVIQAVLADGFETPPLPNAYGESMFIGNDATKPNEAYFKHVDAILDIAREKGLAVALVATWGDMVGPQTDTATEKAGFLNLGNARAYGRFLGNRYKDRREILWVLGGDRSPKGYEDIWRELAMGIGEGDNDRHLMTYHPNGWASSADFLHKEPWLDFNMWQSGHSVHNVENFTKITADYNRKPVKPILDAEPPYENHPVNYNPVNGWFDDYDVRQAAYWAVFAGAFGHTYGCNDIWQFHTSDRKPLAYSRNEWKDTLDFPGAYDMIHLRNLMESRPFLSRIPSQGVVSKGRGTAGDSIRATKGDGYIMVYAPTGKGFTIKLDGNISGETVKAYWYDPREGTSVSIGEFPSTASIDFVPPSSGRGNDWVLVIDDASRNFPTPGTIRLGM